MRHVPAHEREGGATPPAMRASDADRETAADALRAHCAAGRLNVGELEERLIRAYGAVTLDEVAVLLSDLPTDAVATVDAGHGVPRLPGYASFSERFVVNRTRALTLDAVHSEIVPWLGGYGYHRVPVVGVAEDELRLVFRDRPGWTVAAALLVFPLGLLALTHRPEHELGIRVAEGTFGDASVSVYGVAPLAVRRTFARLARGRGFMPQP